MPYDTAGWTMSASFPGSCGPKQLRDLTKALGPNGLAVIAQAVFVGG
jgi:hypothetical protein